MLSSGNGLEVLVLLPEHSGMAEEEGMLNERVNFLGRSACGGGAFSSMIKDRPLTGFILNWVAHLEHEHMAF